jgi:hypothetical protein
MNIPGFTAERSFSGTRRQYFMSDDNKHNRAIKPQVVSGVGRDGAITPASARGGAAPGGPSTVPVGYERTCEASPYTVCDRDGCRTEYGWVCYYRPL